MDWSRIIMPQSFLFEMEVIMATLAQLILILNKTV